MTKRTTRQKRQAAKKAPSTIPDAHDLVPRSAVIAFIADAWLPRLPADIVREVRDKVGAQIRTAVRTGKLKPPQGNKFVFGEVIDWARQKPKWRGLFDELPPILTPITGKFTGTLSGRYSMTAGGYTTPDSLPECKVVLDTAWRRIRALEDKLRALEVELRLARGERDSYREDAIRYREFKTKSGRRGR